MNARPLTLADFEDLATGAWVLGTGGGGDPYHSFLELRELVAGGAELSLISHRDLADDDDIGVVGLMGAPLVNLERLTDGAVMAETVRMMERHRGRPFRALMLWEIGGANAFQPFLAAAHLGIPVVDCDAMGRAFPQADMTTFAICDLKPYPWTMVDIRRNRILFEEAEDWYWVEKMTRKACGVFGSAAATCKAPRTGLEAKTCSVLDTVTKAMRIGRTMREALAAHLDPIDALIGSEGGRLLFRGKVRDVSRRATEGHLRGTLAIDGLEEDSGHDFVVDFQNEFTVAWRDGEVAATVPDLICLLDSASGQAIGTETVRFGQRVTVVALPAPDILLTEKGIRHVGPRAFGYDLDFRSIFEGASNLERAKILEGDLA